MKALLNLGKSFFFCETLESEKSTNLPSIEKKNLVLVAIKMEALKGKLGRGTREIKRSLIIQI